MKNKFEEVYMLVRKIPKGKVTTYGAIAKYLKTSPRVVGNALHKNINSQEIPCHRVVNRNGRIAESYAFGGAEAQRKRLEEEGIGFKDRLRVNLALYWVNLVSLCLFWDLHELLFKLKD